MAGNQKDGNGRTALYARWEFYASLLSGLAIVVAAFIWVGTIASEVAQSQKEEEEMYRRLSKIEGNQSGSGLAIATLGRDEREIETQFCASDIVRNLMHANDQRQLAMLWEKVYGQKYPTDNTFYPQICAKPTEQQ